MPVPSDFSAVDAAKAVVDSTQADVQAAANALNAAEQAYADALVAWDTARYAVETEAVNVGGTPFPGS